LADLSVNTRLTIQNKKGLHARAAAKFVKTVGQFDAKVVVCRCDGLTPVDDKSFEGCKVSGSSILGLMMLGADPGCAIALEASGPDAAKALEALTLLINNKFGEE